MKLEVAKSWQLRELLRERVGKDGSAQFIDYRGQVIEARVDYSTRFRNRIMFEREAYRACRIVRVQVLM